MPVPESAAGHPESFQTLSNQGAYEVDVAPGRQRIAAAFFELIGPGGNGNGKPLKKGEYVSNGGRIRIYSLAEKQAKKQGDFDSLPPSLNRLMSPSGMPVGPDPRRGSWSRT